MSVALTLKSSWRKRKALLIFSRSHPLIGFDRTDFRSSVPRFVDLLGTFAKQKKATPGQIALAWPLAKKPWIVPIPGITKLARLEEKFGALEVDLTPDDVHDLEDASSKIRLEGARYLEFHEKLTGR